MSVESSRSGVPTEEVYAFPASFAQQRLWFLDQLMPDQSFYNIHAAVPLTFAVDAQLVQAAVDALVARHETLRTTLVERDGDVVQLVRSTGAVPVALDDLTGLPAPERGVRLRDIGAAEAAAPFDLSAGPLLRIRLARCAPQEHVLYVTIHHIISDAWSMGIFFQDFVSAYTRLASGQPVRLPDLAIQYADFSVWQRDQLRGEQLERHLDFWRDALAGCEPFELPTDRLRPATPSLEAGVHVLDLTEDLTRRIDAFARRRGATSFMVWLAAFFALLHRRSGQDEVVIGVPVAGRDRRELEPLIGFFVNTLVFRADLSDQPTFTELVDRVRGFAAGAFAHQDVPFERLVDELRPERDLTRNPLFEITFQLHNEPGVMGPTTDRGAGANGRSSASDVKRNASNFDLGFDLWSADRSTQLSIHYATDLFDPSTIVRLGGHFRRLAESAMASPDVSIAELDLIDDDELDRVVRRWNRTATEYPSSTTLAELFECQARSTPDAVALSADRATMSYGELDRHSARVAAELAQLGVGPDVTVGLLADRSLDLVIAILGIVRAAGAYVALDPRDPPGRLGAMVEAAGCPVVIVDAEHLATARSLPGDRRVVRLCDIIDVTKSNGGDTRSAARGTGRRASARAGRADDLAYVSFTSGSTGVPKGVAVPQRAVTRLVKGANFHEYRSDEVYLLASSLAFDASTFELWGSLLNGARLEVAPAGPLSLAELGRLVVDAGVTTLWLTAGLFHQMVDQELEQLAGVTAMLAGGDVVSAPHVQRFLSLAGDRRMVNGYGPTENTTFTCCHVMGGGTESGTSVPIGRPISNTRVYVLDQRRRPVPIGVPGELYVAGDGLARGYVGNAAATAEVFLEGPFDHVPEERLYRTGDLVRYRPDGAIDFLGRIDRQLKLRGFRIEPSEVEAVIIDDPQVRDVVVASSDSPRRRDRLTAYVVTAGGSLDHDVLRRHMREHLPAYMVPGQVVEIDEIPLTRNGKVDQSALTALSPHIASSDHTAPSTEFELALLPIWQEVLGIDAIGAHDDFFVDLGGHSLLATQLVARIRETFDIDLPLRALFESPKLASFAVAVEEALLDEIEAAEVEEFDLERDHDDQLSVDDALDVGSGVVVAESTR